MTDLFARKGILVTSCLAVGALAGGAVLFLLSSSSEPESSPTVQWLEPLQVASGEAFRGPWEMNDSDWRFVDDPTVALTNEGDIGVAWTDHVQQDLFFQRYDDEGEPQLETPVNVSNSPDVFSWLPRMVIPEEEPRTLYVLWQEIVFSGGTHGGEIFFARSTDGGRTFSEPINLSTTQAGAGKGRLSRRLWHNGSLDLAVPSPDTIYAAWTEYEGPLRLSRSTDGGAHFSEPLHVAGRDTMPARGPSLAVDGQGTLHLAWAVGEDPAADIRYAYSTDQGRSFSEPQVVAESEGHSDAPSLAVDRSGTLHLAYGEQLPTSSGRGHIRYTRKPPAKTSFEAPKSLSGDDTEQAESAHFPTLRVTGDTVAILWERYPGDDDRPLGLRLTVSSDGGSTFSSPSLVPGSADPALGFNGSQQGLLMEKLALNDRGALAVVNSTFDRGDASYIWLHRGQVSGP